MNRRRLMRILGAASIGAGLGAATPARDAIAARPRALVRQPTGAGAAARQSASPTLHPVVVDPAREIRTIVGLRPFRPSGFRLAIEKLGDKTVVHDYGHGGAGVTLSWGTAELAVEHAQVTGQRSAAVLGAGAIGLATAHLLQRRGWDVVIYAAALPPDTTSDVAGALWSPYLVSDPGATTSDYDARYERALRLAYRRFQQLPGARYGIHWIVNYMVSDGPQPGPPPSLADLYIDRRTLSPDEYPFPRPNGWRFTTMLIETPIYMSELLREFRLAGGTVVVREFADRSQIAALPEPVIMNCTGLGARALFGDDALIPIKGQLTFLVPQPEIDYSVISGDLYMFPRQDGILLGGTHERGVETLTPDLEAKHRILTQQAALFDW